METEVNLERAQLHLIGDQVNRASAAIVRMGQRLDNVEDIQSRQQQEIGGMKQVIESNTNAMNRFASALDRIDERLDKYVERFGQHELYADREFSKLPRTAITLWTLSIALAASALGWVWLILWPGIAHQLHEFLTRIVIHGVTP